MRQEDVTINLDRFTRDREQVIFDLLGHRTLNSDKGKNGLLKVIVHVVQEAERWRKGQDIFSQHYITLDQALKGCKVSVPTVHGSETVNLSQFDAHMKHIFEGKGVLKTNIHSDDDSPKTGNHIAHVTPLIPRSTDN